MLLDRPGSVDNPTNHIQFKRLDHTTLGVDKPVIQTHRVCAVCAWSGTATSQVGLSTACGQLCGQNAAEGLVLLVNDGALFSEFTHFLAGMKNSRVVSASERISYFWQTVVGQVLGQGHCDLPGPGNGGVDRTQVVRCGVTMLWKWVERMGCGSSKESGEVGR